MRDKMGEVIDVRILFLKKKKTPANSREKVFAGGRVWLHGLPCSYHGGKRIRKLRTRLGCG